MVYKNLDRTFFPFVTIHAFDRRTDAQVAGRTDSFLVASPRWHSMQRGKKIVYVYTRLVFINKVLAAVCLRRKLHLGPTFFDKDANTSKHMRIQLR